MHTWRDKYDRCPWDGGLSYHWRCIFFFAECKESMQSGKKSTSWLQKRKWCGHFQDSFICKDSHGIKNPYRGLVYMSFNYARLNTVSITLLIENWRLRGIVNRWPKGKAKSKANNVRCSKGKAIENRWPKAKPPPAGVRLEGAPYLALSETKFSEIAYQIHWICSPISLNLVYKSSTFVLRKNKSRFVKWFCLHIDCCLTIPFLFSIFRYAQQLVSSVWIKISRSKKQNFCFFFA